MVSREGFFVWRRQPHRAQLGGDGAFFVCSQLQNGGELMRMATAIRPATDVIAHDRDVRERIRREFLRTGDARLQRVRVEVHEGLVVLRGRVNSFYQKQLAQEAAKRVDGTKLVQNEIVVA